MKRFSNTTNIAATLAFGTAIFASTGGALALPPGGDQHLPTAHSNNPVIQKLAPTRPAANAVTPKIAPQTASAPKPATAATANTAPAAAAPKAGSAPAARAATSPTSPPINTGAGVRDHRSKEIANVQKSIDDVTKGRVSGYCDPQYSGCQQGWNIPGTGTIVVHYTGKNGQLLPEDKEKVLAALHKLQDSVIAKSQADAQAKQKQRQAVEAQRGVQSSNAVVHDHRR